MGRRPLLDAALDAADRGWSVFPLVRAGKIPAIRDWEQRATRNRRQIHRWWSVRTASNVAVAAGKSGLVVVDLDQAGGGRPPERFAGARDGWDVLSMLAAEAGVEPPSDTFTVATPGGCHLYFRAPAELELRNTAGSLGWRIDTRGHGGYVVAAGSVRAEGRYVIVNDVAPAELPGWLARALVPPPPPAPGPVMQLPRQRAGAYVRAIVEREAQIVATAQTGTRHRALLAAARTLGRLVGGGELAENQARAALLDAAAGHVGVDGCTAGEVRRTVEDGLRYGRQLPRRIAQQIAAGERSADQRCGAAGRPDTGGARGVASVDRGR